MEGAVAQDPGVAHHTVHGAEFVKRGLDDVRCAVLGGDAVVVGDRPAPLVANLGDDLIGHRRTGARAVAGATEVVDHDAGALPGERKGVFAAQATAGSSNDDDAILHSGHQAPLRNHNSGL